MITAILTICAALLSLFAAYKINRWILAYKQKDAYEKQKTEQKKTREQAEDMAKQANREQDKLNDIINGPNVPNPGPVGPLNGSSKK